MRLHVTYQDKKTTVSIDDQLMDYLGAWLVKDQPAHHSKAKVQFSMATAYIQRYIAENGAYLPSKNLSQHIQALIIQRIAAPQLEKILDVRGPRYQKQKPDFKAIFPDNAHV